MFGNKFRLDSTLAVPSQLKIANKSKFSDAQSSDSDILSGLFICKSILAIDRLSRSATCRTRFEARLIRVEAKHPSILVAHTSLAARISNDFDDVNYLSQAAEVGAVLRRSRACGFALRIFTIFPTVCFSYFTAVAVFARTVLYENKNCLNFSSSNIARF